MAPIAIRPIDQLDAEWATLSATPASRLAYQQLANIEPTIGELNAEDLGGLVRCLRADRSGAARLEAAAIFRVMLRRQALNPLLTRAILQAIVPGLVTVARRLSWGSGGDWDDPGAFFADLIAISWEVIIDWSGDDRAYAVLDLLSAIRCRMRRQIIRQRSTQKRLTFVGNHDAEIGALPRQSADLSDLDVLAKAIDELEDSGMDPHDAAVVYANRVLGFSMTDLVQLTGRSRRHLDLSRARAIRQLCA